MRGDPGRAEHFSKMRAPPAFRVKSASLTGIRLNQAKVEDASSPALALNHAETPPASYPFFLPLNLESKTQVREEQQRGKRDNAAPSSGSLEP